MQRAQVVVLAGPSGAGKSRLAERLGLPVLRLDDFYKDGDDPTLPRITHGANAGLVDWDDPASWHREDALVALRELCATGRSEVPVYEIAQNGRCGVPRRRPRRQHRGSSPRGSSPRRSSRPAGTRAARGGLLHHPAPARHLLAPPHPRPARAPQAAADAPAPRRRPHAGPAAGRRPRAAAGVPPRHGRPGLRRADRVGPGREAAAEAARPPLVRCRLLVMARRLVHPRYAGLVTDQETFAPRGRHPPPPADLARRHRRRLAGAVAARPRHPAVGGGTRAAAAHRRPVRRPRRCGCAARLAAPARRRRPTGRSVVFVGDRLLPRHVVLVTGVERRRRDDVRARVGAVLTEVPRRRWEGGDLAAGRLGPCRGSVISLRRSSAA